MERRTFSHQETLDLGAALGRVAQKGSVIAISGDLGAGKTVFAKGMAVGMGVVDVVTSPTFVLMQIYKGQRGQFLHADLYRLSGFDEAIELGMEEHFESSVSLIEWPSRCPEILPQDALSVHMEIVGDSRVLKCSSSGPLHSALLDEWLDV